MFPDLPPSATELLRYVGTISRPIQDLVLHNIGGHFEYSISNGTYTYEPVGIWNTSAPYVVPLSRDVSLELVPYMVLWFMFRGEMTNVNLVSGFDYQCPNNTYIRFDVFTGRLVASES